MIRYAILAAVACGALGVLWGMTAPGLPPDPVVGVRGSAPDKRRALTRPNEVVSTAVAYLKEALVVPPPAPPAAIPVVVAPTAPAPPPPPPPPDVAVVFRSQVTAVVRDPGAQTLGVLLFDPTGAQRVRRLQVGDRYNRQWTLAALTENEAVLRNGAQERRIALYGGRG